MMLLGCCAGRVLSIAPLVYCHGLSVFYPADGRVRGIVALVSEGGWRLIRVYGRMNEESERVSEEDSVVVIEWFRRWVLGTLFYWAVQHISVQGSGCVC